MTSLIRTAGESGYSQLGRLLTRYARPYWRQILLLVAVNFFVTFLTMLNPVILAPILDVALGRTGSQAVVLPASVWDINLENLGSFVLHSVGLEARDSPFRVVIYLGIIYFIVNALSELSRFANYLLALFIRLQSSRDLQFDMYRHVLSLPMSFFARHRTGDLVSRLENDANGVAYGFEGIVGPTITSVLLIGFYGALLIHTNPRLTLAAVAAIVLHYIISKGLQKPIRKKMKDQFAALGNVSAVMQEAFLSIRVVKSFAAENFEFERFGRAIRSLLSANMHFGLFKNMEAPLRSVTDRLIDLGILLPASYELLSGRLSAASFFLFLYVVRAMVQPINALGQVMTSMNATIAASERVFEVMEEPVTVYDGSESTPRLHEGFRIEHVNFSYGERPILRDVSFVVARGERVAFVGPSGAGKSTLFDMILRFYDPSSGRILFDSIDIKQFRQSDYRGHFGVVAQESLLFNASIRDNIAYGRTGISTADVEWAAHVANAHEFIQELPDGYKTTVGDRGIRLSGGQRQRIAIARAIVGRPDILLLDEATSALDSESERQVQEAIDRVTKEATSLIIAHRLSTVLHADKIIVMNQGKIEAVGPHDELLKMSSTYRQLYSLQFEVGLRDDKQYGRDT